MTADEAREDRRLKCIHLFGGEQFRPCDGRCPRMREWDRRTFARLTKTNES